jgi:hypothetical protein
MQPGRSAPVLRVERSGNACKHRDTPTKERDTFKMISTTCHCGSVTIEVAHAPSVLTNCDCSICRRYGTLWAYYQGNEVQISCKEGTTSTYAWGKRSLRFVRCNVCGCVTHWEPTDPKRGPRVGVNARNFEPSQIGNVRIRRLDGADTEKYLDE